MLFSSVGVLVSVPNQRQRSRMPNQNDSSFILWLDWHLVPCTRLEAVAQAMPTRTSHNKNRHGCLTCKQRRKKCDLQKPVCSICHRLRLRWFYPDMLYPPSSEERIRQCCGRIRLSLLDVSLTRTLTMSLKYQNMLLMIQEPYPRYKKWRFCAPLTPAHTHTATASTPNADWEGPYLLIIVAFCMLPKINLNPLHKFLMSGYGWPISWKPWGMTLTFQSISLAFWPALKHRWKLPGLSRLIQNWYIDRLGLAFVYVVSHSSAANR